MRTLTVLHKGICIQSTAPPLFSSLGRQRQSVTFYSNLIDPQYKTPILSLQKAILLVKSQAMRSVLFILVIAVLCVNVVHSACTYNGCKCRPGTLGGVYCGWCPAVTAAGTGGSWSDVYQCSSSGSCCRYGPRQSCANPQSFSPCG